MEHQFELTANVSIIPHDLPLPGGYTLGSDEGRLKLQELMTMCTKLSKQVLDLEKEKDVQAVKILRLKKRVKRLERQRKSSTSQPRRRKYKSKSLVLLALYHHTVFHMAQHVLPAAQLVPQYKPIRRCNNYTVLQSIACSPECKIVGLILLDHCLSHALTATVDVPAVYLQQFWRTVSKVPDTEYTIKFMLDTQQFTYTVDMFRDILHLPVETPENPFVAPAYINTIETFMNRVSYQGVVDKWDFMNNVFQKKESIQYPRFIKLIIADLMKKFPNIPKRLEEHYHSIKDDVPLVSVYTTENVLVRGMLILDALLTAEIRETDDFIEYETVFMKVTVPMNQPQPVVSTQGTNRNTPRAPRTPTVFASPQETKKRKQTARESSSRRITIKGKKQSTPSIPPPGDDQERDEIAEATLLSLTLHKTALLAEARENIAKVQEKLDEEEIDKLVDGDDDDESSASAFADSVLNDDGDDTGSKLEPGSHKEHPEHVSDDDEQKNDKAIKKEKEVVEIVKETNVDDTSAKKHNEVVMEKEVVDMSGSQEIRKEQKQTPTPSRIRSPRNDLSSDKTIFEELVDTVTPTTATSSKTPSTITHQKKSFTAKTRRLPGKKIKEVIQHCDKIVFELTVTTMNEMTKKEMPHLVKLPVNKDREVSPVDISGMVSKEFATHGPKLIEELFRKHMQNKTLNLYPKTKSSTATTSSADLRQQLYLSMKTNPQDQAADPEIWDILKANYRIISSHDATMRITRGNDLLNVVVNNKFRLNTLGFSEWLEVHALASKIKSKSNDQLLKNLRA
ncbi:hypothetical protein Tco_0943645 [Tanacetum coccineum]